MNFKPGMATKKRTKLFADGEYDYEIVGAEEKLSAKGNPMIEVKLKVSVGGESTTVIDYLVAKRAAKLKDAAYSCGLGAKFETGVLNDTDFLHRRGQLVLGAEASDEFGEKNVVTRYLPYKTMTLPPPPSTEAIVARYAKK